MNIFRLLNFKGKVIFYISVFFTILFSLLTVIAPYVFAKIIEYLEMSEEKKHYYLTILYVIIILMTKLSAIILNTAHGFLRVNLLKRISGSYLSVLLKKTPAELKDKNGGHICQLLTQASNDIYILVRVFSEGVVSPILQLIFVTVICFTSDYVIVAVAFIIYMTIFFVVNILLNEKIASAKLKMMNSTIDSYSILSDSVQNIMAIKKNDCLSVIEERYDIYLDKEEKAQQFFWWKRLSLFTINSIQSFIIFLMLFIYGIYGVIDGTISISAFILIVSYVTLFTAPVESMSNVISDIKQSYRGLEKFFAQYQNENHALQKSTTVLEQPPNISFHNVSFSYADGEKMVLSKINMTFAAGKITAIRGDSGTGKTTIAQIITNYITNYSGEVYFSDVLVTDISANELSRLVYHVTQDDFIFMDDLRFNLKVANPLASDEQMLAALKLACIDKINGEPVSLDMNLQNAGDNISGGQKQRISIARLFLKKPAVIILDEATASLDVGNKKIVLGNIRDAFPDATILIISHDSDIWHMADDVFDLNSSYHT